MNSARNTPRSFNWGGAENDDLTPLILEAAATGWPYTQALYVLGCTSKGFKAAAHQRLNGKISAIRQSHTRLRAAGAAWYAEQQRAQRAFGRAEASGVPPDGNCRPAGSIKDAYTAANIDLDIQCSALAGEEGARLASKLRELYEKYRLSPHHPIFRGHDDEFIFDFDWRMLAHAVQRKCLLCSGVKKACHCDRQSAVGDPPGPWAAEGLPVTSAFNSCRFSQARETWHFRIFQGPDLVFCRPACIGNAVVDPRRIAQVPASNVRPACRRDAQACSWALARALFHSAGQFCMTSEVVTEACAPGRHAAARLPVVVLPNEHLRGATLAERLRLTSTQIDHAHAEMERLVVVVEHEEEAACRVRIAKLRADCNAYLSVEIGESIESMSTTLPTVERTVARALLHFDSSAQAAIASRYVDATEVPFILALLKRLVSLKTVAVPLDKDIVGWPEQKVHSEHAYEWLFDLTSGALPGEHGTWRRELDNNIVDYWERKPVSSRFTMFMVAAMHIFDSIGSQFSLTVEVHKSDDGPALLQEGPVPRTLHWVLRHASGWALTGEVVQRSYITAARWHAMVAACFASELPDERSLASQLRARVPPRDSWCKTARPCAPLLRVLGEVRQYYEEVAGTLVLFPSTRHAGLLLLGISPTRISEALACFQDLWADAKVRVPGYPQCPRDARDFALWITGNKANRDIHWHPAPPPPPMPPVPEPGELPDDDEVSSCSEGYSPTSPQYSPTSPTYNPQWFPSAFPIHYGGPRDSYSEDDASVENGH